MKAFRKRSFPVSQVRRFLEPGPVVLVTSQWRGKSNIMTMGWHTVMEFTPSLVGCVISNANRSFEMVKRSKQCVINVPTVDLKKEVVGIGNCSGANIDKFATFGLTPARAEEVDVPLIEECYANFECRLADARLVSKYNFFVWEVVRAHVAAAPKYPRTLHYRGNGVFMVSGRTINLRRQFRPGRR